MGHYTNFHDTTAEPVEVVPGPPRRDPGEAGEERPEPRVQGVHQGERGVRAVPRAVGLVGRDPQLGERAGVAPVEVRDHGGARADVAAQGVGEPPGGAAPPAGDLAEAVAQVVGPAHDADLLAGQPSQAHAPSVVPRRARHRLRARACA